ncbi:MAG: hypothetical protein N3B12_05805 [Armatimonadetes bacterium]|nr:hypothetical protein [Armatimonadota bacterium]
MIYFFAVLVFCLVCVEARAKSDGRTIFRADFSSLDKCGLKFSKDDWRISDGKLILNSGDWWWATATVDVRTNDYELEAVVELNRVPSKDIGLGFIFRKSEVGAATFFISQPLGGYGAFGTILGNKTVWSKECAYALSKDHEVGEHHLRAVVKGDTANFYVDGKLACILDISERPSGEVGLYAHHDAVFKSFEVRSSPTDGKVEKRRQPRPLLSDGKVYRARQPWREAVAKAGKVIDDAIAEGTEGVSGEESMPAYTYRCVTWMRPGVRPFYAYPAFHHTLVAEALLAYYGYTGDRKYLKEALRLAEWEIRHSTPETDKLPYLPYSTTMDGKMGGNVDGDTVMLDKAGIMGELYLKLWKMTKRELYKQAAVRIGETLLKVQLPEGRWQNRVEHATGKVVQDYTSNQVFNIRLMDALYEATGDERYAESAKRALAWLLENPVKTGRWTGYYEDISPDVESIGNWDAIEAARYLIANRHKSPDYLKMAIDITEWVVTTFAVKQDGMWPLVCEQTACMPVMSVHTFHLAQLLSDLYDATGKQDYLKAAISATNAAFDLSQVHEQWYSLALSPLFMGLELAKKLGL